jgi:hypothetical protein
MPLEPGQLVSLIADGCRAEVLRRWSGEFWWMELADRCVIRHESEVRW